jgi:probable biosynthetic protein (TIGR04099 family)
MNVAISPDALLSEIAAPTLRESVLLGMPQLSLSGLSESWLLKDLGHRHWMLLARLAGRAVPDFRDADGAPVYAAFCALSVKDADFASLGENDRLTIVSDISRVSRTQSASRHRLSVAGKPVGEVELVSAFVRRASGGGNHSVARVALDAFPPPVAPRTNGLAALAADLRAGRRARHFDFDLHAAEDETSAAFEIDPCPAQDFNGAGFLYFSSFVAFVDRAEWHFDGRRAARAVTLARDVFFHGNIDPGERLRVRWLAARRGEGRLVHRCLLERAGDGARLAEAFTLRAV